MSNAADRMREQISAGMKGGAVDLSPKALGTETPLPDRELDEMSGGRGTRALWVLEDAPTAPVGSMADVLSRLATLEMRLSSLAALTPTDWKASLVTKLPEYDPKWSPAVTTAWLTMFDKVAGFLRDTERGRKR